MKRIIVGFALVSLASILHAIEGPYITARRAATCTPGVASGQMNCRYRLTDSTSIFIEWVGKDAVVRFNKGDDDGDYGVKFDTKLQCVVVEYGTKGRKEFEQTKIQQPSAWNDLNKLAFISPRTGRVYDDGWHCEKD